MLRSKRFLIGTIVSAILLLLFFYQLDLSETLEALRDANYWWFLPAVVIYFVSILLRSVRWHFLMRPLKVVSIWRLYPVVLVGYMANNLLPIRAGELVRSYFVGQREGLSKSSALGTILLERVFDGIGLLILALAIWPLLPANALLQNFSDDIGVSKFVLVFLISAPFILVLGVFFLVAMSPRFSRWLARILVSVLPGKFRRSAAHLILRFIKGLSSLRRPSKILTVLVLTLPVWLAEAFVYLLVGIGFDLGISYEGMVFTTSASNLATSIPSTAGGVGPFEYATRVTLQGLDVTAEVAAAFAIAVHTVLLVPITVTGLCWLWTRNLGLGDLIRAQKGHAKSGLSHPGNIVQ